MGNIVYFNGKFIQEDEAVIGVKTHALHYGTGCFEGIRAYYSAEKDALFIFRMQDHYKRLLESSKILFIALGHSVEELCDITIDLLRKNFEKTDIYIRPIAYKSDPAVGNFNLKTLKDGFAIYTTVLGRYLNTEKGIRANVSSWLRTPDNSIPPRAKITGSYVNTALAKTESQLSGYQEAIFLDRNGHVVEGSIENIFIVKNGELITPPVSDDILVGITRDTIIRLATEKLNIKVTERSIDRSELYSADEVFLVGTGAEVSPVVEIDRREIGYGNLGRLSTQIKTLYYDLVHGNRSLFPEFLTKVTP